MNYNQQLGSGICSLCLKNGKNKKTCPFESSNLELYYQQTINKNDSMSTQINNIQKIWKQHNLTDKNGNSIDQIRKDYINNKININSNKTKKIENNSNQNDILSNELVIITWNILHSGFIINENPYYDLSQHQESDRNIDNQNINRELRWTNILKLIFNLKPDLIGLQETSFEFYIFLMNFIKNQENKWEILYGGTDYEKTDTIIPSNFIIPGTFDYKGNIINNFREWKQRNSKYGNISLINKSKLSNIKLYFSPFHTNSNHNNSIISTFQYNNINFIWINLHLSIGISNFQLEIIKSNIETIERKENKKYFKNNENIEIIFSGDFNTNNPLQQITKVFKIKQFKTNNNKLQTFCFKKKNFIIDHILFLGNYLKHTKTLIGEEIDSFKCCINPDIGKPPNNATNNSGLKVNCNQKDNELSDHKIIYTKFEIFPSNTHNDTHVNNLDITDKDNLTSFFENLYISRNLDYLKKGFCILFIHGSFNPIHNDHLNSILKVKTMIEKNSNINNQCYVKNIIGILVPTSKYLLDHKKDLDLVEKPFYKDKQVRFTNDERLDMIKLVISDHDWLYYTNDSFKSEYHGTISFKKYLLDLFKRLEKTFEIDIPITLIQIFGEDYALKSKNSKEDKKWRCKLSTRNNDAQLFIKRDVTKGPELYKDFYFQNITSDISSTQIRKALHNKDNNTSKNLEYLTKNLHPLVFSYIKNNKSKLLFNSIKVFDIRKKKKILIKKSKKKISDLNKKSCQEISNTRCQVYKGPMNSNCELSDKNRCTHKKITKKKNQN